MLTFEDLRRANMSRVVRWHGDEGVEDWSLSEWATALVGEAGEACNVIKKINRDDGSMPGNTLTRAELEAQLAEEIADTMIYLDLLAARAGVDLAAAVRDKFNAVSERQGFPERLR